ncbi:MAG: CHASE2 domain-containing protein [Eubacterium sp.]|nr:CHASE2 domain-containing protein [Eubacterium sp.]
MSSEVNKTAIVIAMILAFLLVFFDPFYDADCFVTDHLYTHFSGTDSRIVIVGVDEETLAEYGNFNLWSREKLAELINQLYSDPANAPAVVGLDFILSESLDKESDGLLAEAVKNSGGRIVTGSNIVYRGRVERGAGEELYYNSEYISDIEMPYDELKENVTVGFTNEGIADDGYIRYAMKTVMIPEDKIDLIGNDFQDSFAYEVYKQYCEAEGLEIKKIATNSGGQFQFRYSGETGEFSEVSLSAVLSGKIPAEAFRDAIVMVGAYAPGFQDRYQPATDRKNPMYGVEIHANIIQAFFQNKTMVVANKIIMAVITALLIGAFMIVMRKKKVSLPLCVAFSVLAVIIYMLIGKALAVGGIVIPCVYIIFLLFLADLYFMIDIYQRELKAQMWSFTEAMAAAIDERTPYNASHTRNVAKYCGMMADYMNSLHAKGKEKEHFSTNRREQLVMGALMHDIGKIAVPLEVMNKATRLGGREEEIKKRLDIICLKANVRYLQGEKDEAWYKDIEEKTKTAWEMISKVNGAGFVDEETREELAKVLEYSYEDEPFFTDSEKECLSIVKGTLTNEERKVMESHVTITKRILSKVHFNKYFRNSPILAGQHHECLNGKGYPDGLTAEELSTDARIMAVADICDALLATDRPYKKPIPMEKAFDIMRDMAKNGNIDGKLVEYLYQCLKEQEEAS